jgi:ABC-type nitrate/sulfonate/bicarbonate transport system substrate-binding protein
MTEMPTFSRRAILKLAGNALGAVALASAPPRAALAQTRKSISIANAGGASIMVHQELFKQLGYFEKFDLNVTTDNVTDGSRVVAALLGGTSDICLLAGIQPVFPAIEKGARLKIIAGSNLLPAFALVSGKPDVKTLKDLEGRNVGTGTLGAVTSVLIALLLEKHGIDVGKVSFVNVGSSAEIFRATVAKTVDAGFCEIGYFSQRDSYGVHLVQNGEVWKELSQFTFQGSFTSVRNIEANRDGLVRVLAAQAKLLQFLQSPESKDAYLKARATALPNSKEAEGVAEWTFIQEFKPYNLLISDDRIKFMQETNIKRGIQRRELPVDQIADMSLAREALELAKKLG